MFFFFNLVVFLNIFYVFTNITAAVIWFPKSPKISSDADPFHFGRPVPEANKTQPKSRKIHTKISQKPQENHK